MTKQSSRGIECIFHQDEIKVLQMQVVVLKQELARKSQFIDEIVRARVAQDDLSGSKQVIDQLKDELTRAFKTIAQRDVELQMLRGHKRVKSMQVVKKDLKRVKDMVKTYC